MITRQSCFSALFKLKNSGIDVSHQLDLMQRGSGVPQEVLEFLQDNSPQFQFFRNLQKHQRTLMKNILNYESFDDLSKIKLCSSLITRAMIAVEYKNLDSSLIEDLRLDRVSKALDKAISYKDFSLVNEVLCGYKNAMLLFYKGRVDSFNENN